MRFLIFLILFITGNSLFAQFAQPFEWSVHDKNNILLVSVDIPVGHYLYADKRTKVVVTHLGKVLHPIQSPETVDHSDEFGSGDIIESGNKSWKYSIVNDKQYKVVVYFQGCKDKTKDSPSVCFMPSTKEFTIHPESSISNDLLVDEKDLSENITTNTLLDQFTIINSGGGYLNAKEFTSFLNSKNSSSDIKGDDQFAGTGIFGIILLVLLGGIALNLTPCVLPMIPINLAIIGAGAGEGKGKNQGFIKGAIYGIGIAVAYGVLGLFTVLGGAKFGALNSTYWFNFLIAVVFIILALAMFDLFSIDLTKYSANIGVDKSKKGKLIPIFIMGVVAALLAGACVAPVVIAVLLHSTTLYAEGNIYGLFLPFVLGIGMALPWPFAGAGFALLPKPGMWMVRVKQLMGLFIVLFALYYGYLGFSLLPSENEKNSKDSFILLEEGLSRAKLENKLVFIDFWATWCKNCIQMEHSTFKDPNIIKELKKFVVIKFQAEKPNDPKVKEILDRYKLIGLPGYVILSPKK